MHAIQKALQVTNQTQEGPTVSVSNISVIAFYGCSEIIRTRNFTIFTVYATISGQYKAAFHFFKLQNPIVHDGPTEKFLIGDHPKEDHNEREFKQIIDRILDLLKKSSKT